MIFLKTFIAPFLSGVFRPLIEEQKQPKAAGPTKNDFTPFPIAMQEQASWQKGEICINFL